MRCRVILAPVDERQRENELGGVAADVGCELDVAAVCARDRASKRQPQAETLQFRRRPYAAIERLEQTRCGFTGRTGSGVGYVNAQPVRVSVRRHLDALAVAVLERIVEQIGSDAAKQLLVP